MTEKDRFIKNILFFDILTFSICVQEMCGYEYTNKLQRMFLDVSVSKDLNDNFKEKAENLDSKYKFIWSRNYTLSVPYIYPF